MTPVAGGRARVPRARDHCFAGKWRTSDGHNASFPRARNPNTNVKSFVSRTRSIPGSLVLARSPNVCVPRNRACRGWCTCHTPIANAIHPPSRWCGCRPISNPESSQTWGDSIMFISPRTYHRASECIDVSRNKQNVPAPKIGRGVFQGHCRHPMR